MPCSHGYRSPKEYYDLQVRIYGDKCISVFGRSADEILKALEYWDEHSIHGMDNGKEQIQVTNPQYGEWLNRIDSQYDKYFNKQEQIKMTREETLNKVPLPRWYGMGSENLRGWIIDTFEALGLLKFDEAPKKANKVFQVTKEALQAIKELTGVSSNENNFICTKVGDFVYQSLKEEAPKKVLIEIGKFTHIKMANGNFFQGEIAYIDQD